MSNLNSSGIFITGTDTDIGKTYVSRILADHFAKTSDVTYLKPVQTGCTIDQSTGILKAPDVDYVLQGQSFKSVNYEDHVPYRFEPACSPHLAAELAKKVISFEQIKITFNKLSSSERLILVEGAGGVLAPITRTTYMIDLMRYLQLPVILVTSPKLGTLNNTFLSLRILNENNLNLAGVVFNNCTNEPLDFIYNDNLHMIREYIQPLPFLEILHGTKQCESIDKFCNEIKQQL